MHHIAKIRRSFIVEGDALGRGQVIGCRGSDALAGEDVLGTERNVQHGARLQPLFGKILDEGAGPRIRDHALYLLGEVGAQLAGGSQLE